MKYIITESKLKSIINNYISFEVGDLHQEINPNVPELILWENEYGKIFFTSRNDNLDVFVLSELYNNIKSLFSINSEETLDSIILSWFEENDNTEKKYEALFKVPEATIIYLTLI